MARDSGPPGVYARCLSTEVFAGLSAELAKWRSDHEQQEMQRTKAEGRVFDFVKGLRFSARLIYIIRERLSSAHLEVDWGQVIDDSGDLLSPECDVIIHRQGYFRRWNGGKADQVMDFRFIQRSDIVAVISCKSLVRSITNEVRNYYIRMKPYVNPGKLWLFAECVPLGKEKKIKTDARAAGYAGFWHLYSWGQRESRVRADEQAWADFLTKIEDLGRSHRKSG